MTLTVFDIGGHNYNGYASLEEANNINRVSPVRASGWDGYTDEQKRTYIVAATHRLDLLNWLGSKTGGAAQEEAFPRTGLQYADGTAVPSDAIPYQLVRATALLAATIGGNSKAAEAGASSAGAAAGRTIKRVKAGSAEVEYETGGGTAAVAAQPKQLTDETALAWVAQWLDGQAVSQTEGPAAYGTDGKSNLPDYDRYRGFS